MKELIRSIKEWVKWKVFRPKGSLWGWWNMTEEEIISESYLIRDIALKRISDIFSESRYFLSTDFAKNLWENLEMGRKANVDVQLKLKREKNERTNKTDKN